MDWRKNFSKGNEIVLATASSSGKPNANVVISLGFVDDKLLVANCMMKTTIKNIRENKKVCVVGGYYRLIGEATIFSNGKYFDLCVRENKEYEVCSAILIDVKEVFDLDKVEKVTS